MALQSQDNWDPFAVHLLKAEEVSSSLPHILEVQGNMPKSLPLQGLWASCLQKTAALLHQCLLPCTHLQADNRIQTQQDSGVLCYQAHTRLMYQTKDPNLHHCAVAFPQQAVGLGKDRVYENQYSYGTSQLHRLLNWSNKIYIFMTA